jgi:hypothetical protein
VPRTPRSAIAAPYSDNEPFVSLADPQYPPGYLHELEALPDRLQLSRAAAHRLLQHGQLPRIRVGRRVFVAETDVASYLERQRLDGVMEARQRREAAR